jgi:hypothetical protein
MNLSETMTHNDFSLSNDIIRPLRKFFRQLEIKYEPVRDTRFPEYIFKIPLKKYRKKKPTAISSITEGVLKSTIYSN